MRSLLRSSTQLHTLRGAGASRAVERKRQVVHCRIVDQAASDKKPQTRCSGPYRVAQEHEAWSGHVTTSEAASTSTAEALIVALKSLEDIRSLHTFVAEHCSESKAVQRQLQAVIEAQQCSIACLQQLQRQETAAASSAKAKPHFINSIDVADERKGLPLPAYECSSNTAMSAAASIITYPIVVERVSDVYESKLGLRPQPLVIDSPVSSDDEPEAQQLPGIWAGVAAGRGPRTYMEDVTAINWLHPDQVVLPNSEKSIGSTLIAGVYDGHAGRSTAAYAAAQLPLLLQQELLTSGSHSKGAAAAVDKQQLFSKVFRKLDKKWADQGNFEQSGSTAVTAMISRKNLVVANAGDSVAVLARGATSRRLSKTHDLCCPQELARVTAAGAKVMPDRRGKPRLVQSPARCQRYVAPKTLAVSRGFGDFGFKGVGGDLVIPTPYVTELELTAADDMLIMTSDGITDVLNDDDILEVAMTAVSKARNNTSSGSELAAAAAAAVKDTAATAGAWDNLSVLAILLDWGQQETL